MREDDRSALHAPPPDRMQWAVEAIKNHIGSIAQEIADRRGAAGFWVENGEIAWPVDEFTIAGNLRDMYRAIEAVGEDIDPRSHIRTGSILIGRMTVAGGGEGS